MIIIQITVTIGAKSYSCMYTYQLGINIMVNFILIYKFRFNYLGHMWYNIFKTLIRSTCLTLKQYLTLIHSIAWV